MKLSQYTSLLLIAFIFAASAENEPRQNQETGDTEDYFVGNPLGLPITPTAGGRVVTWF